MKTQFLLLTKYFFLICCFTQFHQKAVAQTETNTDNKINVFVAPELKTIANNMLNSDDLIAANIQVSELEIQPNQIAELLNHTSGFALVTRDYFNEPDWDNLWYSVIGREVVVPVINKANPFCNELIKKGIDLKNLTSLVTTNNMSNWNDLLQNGNTTQIHTYISNNYWVERSITKLFVQNENILQNKNLVPADTFLEKIKNQPYSIGFCRLSDICTRNKILFNDLQLVPIDLNGNNTIDAYENIYANLDNFIRGVWLGKYPKSLIHPIYLVSQTKPANQKEMNFAQWFFNQGQVVLFNNEMFPLVVNENPLRLKELNPIHSDVNASTKSYAWIKILLVLLSFFLIIGIITEGLKRFFTKKYNHIPPSFSNTVSPFDCKNTLPGGLYYDKSHMWSFMEKDGTIRIGLDGFISHITGDITGAMLLKNGEQIQRGQKILEVSQYGKKLEIKSPISGKIKLTNEKLHKDPGLICTSPFNEGWIYVIEPVNWLREIQLMLLADKFNLWLKLEYNRLKDFLSIITSTTTNELTMAILQEGGELKKGILAELSPKVWEDFQTQFIDVPF